jgi:hypothetical protein
LHLTAREIPVCHSHQSVSALEKERLFLLFFSFSFIYLCIYLFIFAKKQKLENQTELNPVTYWNTNPWKAYLCPTRLNPVPVSNCLRKATHHFFLQAWFR